ncbi:Matrilysin [Ancistrocladus abbreviatus]
MCYSGAFNAYITIVRQEVFLALWTGLGPNIARNSITILSIPRFTDNPFTHTPTGLGAGLLAVCIGSPVDMLSLLAVEVRLD